MITLFLNDSVLGRSTECVTDLASFITRAVSPVTVFEACCEALPWKIRRPHGRWTINIVATSMDILSLPVSVEAT